MIGIYEVTGLAVVGFLILLRLTRSPDNLSVAVFGFVLAEIVLVILCYTVQEDKFLNTWRYCQSAASDSVAATDAYNEWINPQQESMKEYWLARLDGDRRRGRPGTVLQYEKRMAVSYDPSNIPLRDFNPFP